MKSSLRNRSLGILLGTVAALSTMAGIAKADDIEVAYLSASSANTWLAASLAEMKKIAEANGIKLTEFDASCFNGEYITGDVDEAYLTHLEDQRNGVAPIAPSLPTRQMDLNLSTSE